MRFVAFLRAINVGGRVVKMTELKKMFEEMGLEQVETFIASGNVIFESKKKSAALETLIEKELEKKLGYRVATFVRSLDELSALAGASPFADAEKIYVGFFKEEPSAEAQKKLRSLMNDGEELRFLGREMWWVPAGSVLDTKLTNPAIERAVGGPTSNRNFNTVQRLVAKFPSKDKGRHS